MDDFSAEIDAGLEQVDLDVALFFLQNSGNATIRDFSVQVHNILDMGLSREKIKDILSVPLQKNVHLLTPGVVEHYFHIMRSDKELVRALLVQFLGLKTTEPAHADTELGGESEEVRATRVVLEALRISAPSDLRKFAVLALHKFPNFRGWNPAGKSYGFLFHLQNLAGYNDRFAPKKPQEKKMLRLKLVQKTPVVSVASEAILTGEPVLSGGTRKDTDAIVASASLQDKISRAFPKGIKTNKQKRQFKALLKKTMHA
jgi:hypothetical protein